MEFFKKFALSIHPVSDESFEKIFKALSVQKFKKNHKLVKIGQRPIYTYILKSGVVRAFNIDDKGKEHTKTIFTPITTSGNLGALIKNKPSQLIYECLTDCELITIDYKAFYNLSLQYHDVSIFHYKILQKSYIREESKILELLMLNASERYQQLQKKIPKIDTLINQYHIASYLNITPVQLSRIRGKVIK